MQKSFPIPATRKSRYCFVCVVVVNPLTLTALAHPVRAAAHSVREFSNLPWISASKQECVVHIRIWVADTHCFWYGCMYRESRSSFFPLSLAEHTFGISRAKILRTIIWKSRRKTKDLQKNHKVSKMSWKDMQTDFWDSKLNFPSKKFRKVWRGDLA